MAGSNDWFKGTVLDSKVLSYLNTRKNSKQSSTWRHEKRPWMRLISGARVGGKEVMTIDNHSGFWNRSGMYEEASGRITARPTIEKISISTTGTAGTMRKAEIEFKVYSYTQLKQAQLAFFIPGISVVALWGWTLKQDGGAVNTKCNVSGQKSMTGVYKKLTEWVSSNDGCSDGLCGLVSDFEWTKATQGGADTKGFDCKITLESPAKGFLEQPADPPSAKHCGCAEGSEDEGDSRETGGGWVKQALKDQAESEMGNMDPGTLWKSGNIVMGTSVTYDSDYQGDDD